MCLLKKVYRDQALVVLYNGETQYKIKNKTMKISFITTVYNEKNSIKSFLESLRKQTITIDEIIIVDAASKDGTRNIIKNYTKLLPIKLFIKKGNRSIGRNFAIQKAKNNIIAVSDAGCILDKNWLKRITNPLENDKIDVVAGFYNPVVNNIFEKSLASYTCYPEEKVDKDFLPSSRSIAFKKTSWEKVNGYPEELDTCEDLVFAKNMKKKGVKFKVVKSAIVYWPQRANIFEAAAQFFAYAKGDGKALYIRPQTPLLFIRYIIGIVILLLIMITDNFFLIFIPFVLFSFYILWSILKNFDYVNHVSALIYLPVLQIVSDIMVMAGFSLGFLSRIWVTKK